MRIFLYLSINVHNVVRYSITVGDKMIYQTPRQSGKAVSQKIKIISIQLAQHNPITLVEAWDFVLEYWRDNYGKELTYGLVEKEYRKRGIMNRVGTGCLSLNFARIELENLENGEINEK